MRLRSPNDDDCRRDDSPRTGTTPASRTRSRRSGRTAGRPSTPSGRRTRRGRSREGFDAVADRKKLFVLDMFPYPSGKGLHVGHPLGFIGTDVYARFKRMTGHNVLHAMGYDAFGLPAEQYAVQTGQHPRVATEANVANMRRQLRALGLGHDPRRSVATTDPAYYRWTQWIFLQLFNSWYDEDADRARSDRRAHRRCSKLIPTRDGPTWTRPVGARSWTPIASRTRTKPRSTGARRSAPCWPTKRSPPDGRSERGNHPVYRRPLKQWMLRITAYAERLLADLDLLDWTDSIKRMQRNWIGRSEGAEVDFAVEGHEDAIITVFTTRPDTLFGATYMVLAPEHPLVDRITPVEWPARHSARTSTTSPLVARHLRRRGGPGRCRPQVPRVRRAEERARAPGRGQGEDRRLHRRLRHQPRQRPADPDLRRRLRADGLRHRRDHGRARARPTRLRVRRRSSTSPIDGVDPTAGELVRRAPDLARHSGRRLARGVRRRRCRDELRERRRLVGRAPRRGGQAGDQRVARAEGARLRDDHVQAARLAVQPAALLG